jgi:hypothetical protein
VFTSQTLLICLGAVSLASIIVMVILSRLADLYQQRLLKAKMEEIDSASQYRRTKPRPKKNDEFLSKDKKKEAKKELEEKEIELSGVVPYDPLGQSVGKTRQQEQVNIVGFSEPVGVWTKFVMKQKLGFMLARMSMQNNNDKGYWVNLIKAQSASQGKDQSRGR